MKLKVVIIDDEIDAIDVLENIIQIKNVDYDVVGKTTSPIEGIKLINEHKPDVVFLDIEMPELNGFEVLKSIADISFEVIFATAYEHYALKAIKQNALDYILKPATIPEVLEALEKAKQKRIGKENNTQDFNDFLLNVQPKRSKRIKIPTASGFELIREEEVMYFKADGSYSMVHMIHNNLLVSKSIKQMEPSLNPEVFFRVHRSFIVNTQHVKRYLREDYSLIMDNGDIVPVSHRKLDDFITFVNSRT